MPAPKTSDLEDTAEHLPALDEKAAPTPNPAKAPPTNPAKELQNLAQGPP